VKKIVIWSENLSTFSTRLCLCTALKQAAHGQWRLSGIRNGVFHEKVSGWRMFSRDRPGCLVWGICRR